MAVSFVNPFAFTSATAGCRETAIASSLVLQGASARRPSIDFVTSVTLESLVGAMEEVVPMGVVMTA